ncbi:hypothetical protein KAH94_03185 [bacterium]|nr:hypothetical protein [bacterium]
MSNKSKKQYLKNIRKLVNSLLLGLQEPLINEFTQIDNCIQILNDVKSMLKRFKKLEDINNNHGEKNA